RDAGPAEPLGSPIPQSGIPHRMLFSPDGKLFATACYEKRGERSAIRFWDVASRQPVGEPILLSGVSESMLHRVAFSPDGKRLVTVDRSEKRLFRARLWQVPTCKPRARPLW